MNRTEIGKRLGVFALVVLVVLSVAAAAPLVDGDGAGEQTLENPEYDPGTVVPEPLAAGGSADPQVPGELRAGVVLIDRGHGNGADRAAIAPLVRGLSDTGHEVRFHTGSGNLSEQLPEADAFVVIDPASGFDEEEVDAVKEFTADGGRLLLVGEPDRIQVSGFFVATLTTRSSELSSLASAHGIAFDTRYLYNLESNDGNYKHVLAEPASGSPIDDVGRATIYTGTAVSSNGGTPLLVTTDGTKLSDGGESARHTVAVRRDNVIAVGDSTFLRSDRYTIADNEAFLAYLIEFLAGV